MAPDTPPIYPFMKITEITRTATFAWYPEANLPLLATATVANHGHDQASGPVLEIWDIAKSTLWQPELGGGKQPKPHANVPLTGARIQGVAWGNVQESQPQGYIVAGLETGQLDVLDVSKVLTGSSTSDSLIATKTTHTGPIGGLDFNPVKTELFASGATDDELYVWNLADMSKPYSPGVPNTKLDRITALSWNHQVAHVFAVAGTAGVTTIWDLRSRRDMTGLSYNDQKGDRGSVMSDLAWQPDNSTRLVTACDDSSSPVLTIWDLRNSSTPEATLTGHDKGVLSVSWNKDHPDRLLSSGKDGRVIIWDPKAGNGIGVEVLSAQEWVHQIGWSAHRPDTYAAASFDGTVGVYDMTTTDKDIDEPAPPYTSGDNASLNTCI